MDYKATADLLLQQDHILILTHRRPDGDTVGSAVGLCAALRGIGKSAFILEDVDVTNQFKHYLADYLAPADYQPSFVISVDVAVVELLTESGKVWLERGIDFAIDFAIDHHPSYGNFAKECCVEPACAACGELIYHIISNWGAVSTDSALGLYVALVTDTGGFMYSNTTTETHRIAGELMATGIDFTAVNKRHMQTKTMGRLKLESHLLESMDVHDDGGLVLAGVSIADMERLATTDEDAEDISAFLGQIAGVKTAVTIREIRPNVCKMSLRTSVINATTVCGLLGGGGHHAAAGCTVEGTVVDAKKAMVDAIRQVERNG